MDGARSCLANTTEAQPTVDKNATNEKADTRSAFCVLLNT
jgi:hypothetical protein